MIKLKIFLFFVFFNIINITYASEEKGVLEGLTWQKIRTGDIHFSDLAPTVSSAADYLLGYAATISIIFIIIGAYKILFGSISSGTSEGKKTIFYALGGLLLALLSWVIVKAFFSIFS